MPENRLTWVSFDSVVGHLHNVVFRDSLAVHKVPLLTAGGVGMTGEQRHHILPRLDKDVFDLVGLNDLRSHHPIPQAFPQVGDPRRGQSPKGPFRKAERY